MEEELYAFNEISPVLAYKIADFTSIEYLIKITSSTILHNEHSDSFSVCYVVGNNILTSLQD